VSATPTQTPSSQNSDECAAIEIKQTLLALDGGAATQLKLIKRVTSAASKGRTTASQRKQLNSINTSASKTYSQMWTSVWSYQTVILSCSNTVNCVAVDISEASVNYSTSSTQMVRLMRQAISVFNSVKNPRRVNSKALKAAMDKQHSNNLNDVRKIPVTQSYCP
jgi:hypothetical protein